MRQLIRSLLSPFNREADHTAKVEFGAIMLLQPDHVLQQRGIDLQAFSAYLTSSQASVQQQLSAMKLPPSAGFLVHAVRPGDKVNAWFDMDPALPASQAEQVLAALRAVPGFPVGNGTVLFASQLSINGAPETTRQMPFPKEWKAAAQSNTGPVDIEQLLKTVWP